jgi:hypothetical protein
MQHQKAGFDQISFQPPSPWLPALEKLNQLELGTSRQPGQRSAESDRTKRRLELAGLTADAAFAMGQFAMSKRRACRLVGLDRSSYRYEPRADHNAELREALVKLARQKPRYGYRRLHVLLSKRGHPASAQRIYRLYREEQLMVRRLRRKRLVRPANEGRLLLRPDQEWAVDFACDALTTRRGILAQVR